MYGKHLSEEWKKKIGEPQKGKKKKPMSPETRKLWVERQRKAQTGKKLTEEHKRKIAEAISGKKNYLWKGDDASYSAFHAWLKRKYGKPTKCENKNCTYPRVNSRNDYLKAPKRFEWALIKGKKHSHNRKNYMMLCTSCHQLYDWNKLVIE